MKPRKRLNHISKKNSKKWVNRKLIDEYMEANPRDELRRHLNDCGFLIPCWDSRPRQFECHHIFGNFGQRWDLLSNVVSVSPSTHDWLHDHKHQADWRLIGLWVKHSKGELCLVEFTIVTGKRLAGWLDMNPPTLPILIPMHRALTEFCSMK
jgi:hypothetical protein